jgi:hypothetical protein
MASRLYEIQTPSGVVRFFGPVDDPPEKIKQKAMEAERVQFSRTAAEPLEQPLEAAPQAAPDVSDSLADTVQQGASKLLTTPEGRQMLALGAMFAVPASTGAGLAQAARALGVTSKVGQGLARTAGAWGGDALQGILGASAVKAAGADSLSGAVDAAIPSPQEAALDAGVGVGAGIIGRALPRKFPGEPGVSISADDLIRETGGRFGSPVTIGQAVDPSNLSGQMIQKAESAASSIPGFGAATTNARNAAVDAARKAILTHATPPLGKVPNITDDSVEMMADNIGNAWNQGYEALSQQAPMGIPVQQWDGMLETAGLNNLPEFSNLPRTQNLVGASGPKIKEVESALKEVKRDLASGKGGDTAVSRKYQSRQIDAQINALKQQRAATYPEVQKDYDILDPQYRQWLTTQKLTDQYGGDFTMAQANKAMRRGGFENEAMFTKGAKDMLKEAPNSGTQDRAAVARVLAGAGLVGTPAVLGYQAGQGTDIGGIGGAALGLGTSALIGQIWANPLAREMFFAINKMPQGAARNAALMELINSMGQEQ